MNNSDIIICQDLHKDLTTILKSVPHDKLYILSDETTRRLCVSKLNEIDEISDAIHITIGAGDVNKNISTLSTVWQALSESEASRHSLMVCLGGGMVTDLGGFAASTFKRGIPYINVPTTLLAMVDAAVGGKTAINFNGLKNEIGVFCKAKYVLIETDFLSTIDNHNLLSGYAEMLKHGLISNDETTNELLAFNLENVDLKLLKSMVAKSIQVKEDIVAQDPCEKGIRKALNFGHTIGHAFEALALKKLHPVLHGYAVAWGMVCELYLSYIKTGFPRQKMQLVNSFIKDNYGAFYFTCDDYDTLYDFMKHDKKNSNGIINFSLLEDTGILRLDQTAEKKQITETFDFFRECMGL